MDSGYSGYSDDSDDSLSEDGPSEFRRSDSRLYTRATDTMPSGKP